MSTVDVVDLSRRKVDSIDLPADVFGAAIKGAVLHEAVRLQQAGLRQGTASTKTRGLVSGTGKKPYKQKHTGRARAGSVRSPLWRHGGTTFGPRPRDYRYGMPKQKARGIVRAALSVRASEGGLVILDEMPDFDGKTKTLAKVLDVLGLHAKTLIVTGRDRDRLRRAAANLPGVTVVDPEGINVRDVLLHDVMLMGRRDFTRLQEVWR